MYVYRARESSECDPTYAHSACNYESFLFLAMEDITRSLAFSCLVLNHPARPEYIHMAVLFDLDHLTGESIELYCIK